jgi:Vacuolar sorting-associated protein 13, N-terminal/N-terminal region of Chorein or VPS13
LRSHKLFRDLGLSIAYGEIHSLEVIIPWASLLSSPVKILIDGINLQVGPLDAAQLGKKEIREQLISSKMDQLRIADESIDYNGTTKALEGADKGKTTPKTAANTKATYVQQWTAKIIDNLEITLKNVHIRYEDSQTLPGSNFSAGVTLKSFTVSSCDENWTEKFIGRDLNKARTAMRKLAKISNLGLYWMSKSAVLKGMPFVDWSSQMNSLIYSGSSLNASSIKDIDYLMHPDSSLLLKLIHDDSNKSIPKFDISLESSDFLFSVDRTQYLQLMCTMKAMDSVRTIRQPLVDRPQERPASSKDCVIWWKYAIKLVMRKKEYIRLVKLSKTVDQDGHMDIRTEGEKARSRVLEIWIPLRALVIFRHACAKELQKEAHERHEHLVKVALENGLKCPVLPVKEEPRSWMGWMRGTAKTAGKVKEVTEDDDVSLESIITSLEHADGIVEEDVTPEYKVCVTTSATLNLSVDGSQFATATMALSVVAETSAQGMTATAHLCDLLVIDKCSVKPMNPNIIAVKQKIKSPSKGSVSNVVTEALAPKERILNTTPSFSIVYEKLGSKTKARLTALPVEITLNKMCIQQLVGFFLPSPAAPPAILEEPLKNTHSPEIHHTDGGEGSFLHVVDSTKSPDHRTQNDEKDKDSDEDEDEEIFEVIFEAHAPNIIIPEGDSAKCGCFLLDTGYITVKVRLDNICSIFSFCITRSHFGELCHLIL